MVKYADTIDINKHFIFSSFEIEEVKLCSNV